MRIYRLPLMLEPQPEGGYTVSCPLIPHLITEVDTLDQVQTNVADALAALLELYEDLGQPLPPELREVVTGPLQMETLVALRDIGMWPGSYVVWGVRKFLDAEGVHIRSIERELARDTSV